MMDISRRKFLTRATSIAANLSPVGQSFSLLGSIASATPASAVAEGLDLITVPEEMAYVAANTNLAWILGYHENVISAYELAEQFAGVTASSSDAYGFVHGLSQTLVSMGDLAVDHHFPFKSWDEILGEPKYLRSIMECSMGDFETEESVCEAISAFRAQPLFVGQQPAGIYLNLKQQVYDNLVVPHLDTIREYDWVGYLRRHGEEGGRAIENLLDLYGKDLPGNVVTVLSSPYSDFTLAEVTAEIDLMPLQRASVFMQLFRTKTEKQDWLIEPLPIAWDTPTSRRYHIYVDASDQNGKTHLANLQHEWRLAHGQNIEIGAIALDTNRNVSWFTVSTQSKKISAEFDESCALSRMKKDPAFLDQVLQKSTQDVAAAARSASAQRPQAVAANGGNSEARPA